MKKTAIIVSVVLVITAVALLLGAAANTRKLDADYDLDFNGTTAICTAVVTGERKDDFIQVTMRLKQENVIWKTWNQEGYFQVALEGTCEDLIKNKVYTLEISAKINGNPQPVLVVSKACSGIVPTQPTIPTTQPTIPTTQPTTAPTTQPTVPPATDPWWVTPTTVPTQPSTKPTQPITQPTNPNLEWLSDREIVPFEDRLKEDVPFGYNATSWLMPDDHFPEYSLEYYLMLNPTYHSCPYIMMEQGIEASEMVYKVPIYLDRLSGMKTLAVDGRWGYFANEYELCRVELLTGELTILATRGESDLRWAVRACGKDTVCIFQLDENRNLRVYYRDLHSDAERTLYQGVLPDVPTSENGLMFYAPTTTQGQAYWEMLNPAFYQAYLKELSNPNSTLKNSPKAVQDHYNIPMLVRYSCDFNTGELTEDFGLYDTCWNTRNCWHDHFGVTREEVPTVLDVAPTEIPNFSKLTGDYPFWSFDHVYTCLFSDFGYSDAYWRGEAYVHKITDFPVTEMEMSDEYIYAITLDGRILQFDRYDTICNTIYTSENEMCKLRCWGGYVWFVDGDTIISIDEATGTWQPILRVSSEVYGFGWDYNYKTAVTVYIRQGMFCQKYRYDLQTKELTAID